MAGIKSRRRGIYAIVAAVDIAPRVYIVIGLDFALCGTVARSRLRCAYVPVDPPLVLFHSRVDAGNAGLVAWIGTKGRDAI